MLPSLSPYFRNSSSLRSTNCPIALRPRYKRKKIESLEAQILDLKQRARQLAEAPDRATQELHHSNRSNIVGVYGEAVAAGTQVMNVIVPQDPTARDRIHQRLASAPQLRTSDEWKEFVFVEVLGQPLEGTDQVFASPTPMRVIEE
ncbi:MAG: hypothetical protein O3C21_06905 [Verrucomicrobia bacterium]|nr:hypothetical protein [Verrucomicrobiota bacterium]